MTKSKSTKKLITKATAPTIYTVPAGKVLVMRCCRADMTSHNGFVWPSEGEAFAPDFKPIPQCGNGLHGWLWGEGNITAAGEVATQPDAKWLIVEVAADAIINLEGKVKFERGIVRNVGTCSEIAALMQSFASSKAVIFGTATAGYAGTATAGARGTATAGFAGTATAGYAGTATAGYAGTATAGYAGTATAGYAGTATAGDAGTATAGDAGTATAGYAGTATAGARGTATAGYAGTATAGYAGTATAGYAGTATAGDAGTATAGYAGTATAGDAGTLLIKRWDSSLQRYRWTQGEVGIDGIEANVPYKLDDNGKLVKA